MGGVEVSDAVLAIAHNTSVTSFLSNMRVLVYLLAATRVASFSSTPHSRSCFLSSSAAVFFSAGAVLASDPSSCAAQMEDSPRYIDRELEMKYAEDKGMSIGHKKTPPPLPHRVVCSYIPSHRPFLRRQSSYSWNAGSKIYR